MSIHGQTAIVTGATSGIGKETAVLLAQSGVKVFAVGRRHERLLKLQSVHPSIVPVCCDIARELKPLEDAIRGSSIDILINNAGLALGREPIQSAKRADWEIMIDTNIKSLIAVSQLIIPHMLERKNGDIVNLGSIAGFSVYPAGSIYNATKYAVRALTEAWRMDLIGQGIRVMGIHPGMVETEFSIVRYGGDTQKARDVYKGMTPLSARDIAETIVWALSRPRHITIQSLVIMPTDQAGVQMVHRV